VFIYQFLTFEKCIQVGSNTLLLKLRLCCCSTLCRRDLGYFEMECPEFTTAAELREDLAKFESMWCVFEEFNSGLQELRKEDWISFRYICSLILLHFTC